MDTLHQVSVVHSVPLAEVWLLRISKRKLKKLLVHFAQAVSNTHTVKKSTKTYIFTARCKYFTTGREIDKEYVDGLFHAEEVGNKHFEVHVQEKLVEDNKSYFQPFCKASLITGNEKKKKKLKPLSVIKEVCQAFHLLANKVVKFTEAFKYAIKSVSLPVAILNPTLYQPEIAGLIDYSTKKFWSRSYERGSELGP